MTRRRYLQINGELVEVTQDYRQESNSPFVMGDLPDYESPIDGRIISGRAQRREDLRRSGCRPWEGMDQERKEAQRRTAYIDAKLDKAAEATAWRAYYQLSPEKRRLLRGA